MAKKTPSQKQGFFASAKDDILLIFKDNKLLLIFILAILIFGTSLGRIWRAYRLELDQDIFYADPALIIVEGEDIKASNGDYWFDGKKGNFRNKYMVLYTKELPDQGYLYFRYVIKVGKPDTYKLFLAGSPPGTKEKGFNTHHCPFSLWIDNNKIKDMYEEAHKEYLKKETGNDFYYYYEYLPGFRFTKLGEFYLTQGKHQIEFRIKRLPLDYDEYKFKVDALFLVPKSWKPKEVPFSLPDDLFSY